MGRLAKTHSSLTFEQLCEEAFGEIGLHPWEFYDYSLTEYMQKRKGYSRRRKDDFQRLLISSMIPYMDKNDRRRIVNEAFQKEGVKALSLRERYEAIKKRYQEAGELIFNNG